MSVIFVESGSSQHYESRTPDLFRVMMESFSETGRMTGNRCLAAFRTEEAAKKFARREYEGCGGRNAGYILSV